MKSLVFLLLLSAAHAGPMDELDGEAAQHEEVADPAARMAADFAENQRRKGEDAERFSSQMQAQYDLLLKNLADQRERQRSLVLKQWKDFHESTTKEWVDYSAGGDAVSRVDFEKGKVEVEVLVPVEEAAKAKPLAQKKIAAQLDKILAQKDLGLKEQLPARDFKKLETKVDPKPVVAQDGKPRLKVTVQLDLLPDHLKIRAKRHEARVASAARRYALDPALLYAVIQTESEFNPRARSQAPAFGLMQLMPKTAAREAYQYLYKEERIVSPDYLYDPDNNILLGATYLHMLRTRHFPKVKDPENQSTLMIAAYNCGPGCVRKNVLAKHDVDAMTNAELLALIARAVPKETQEYVPRVRSRMKLYSAQ